jgi:hypothetical protein
VRVEKVTDFNPFLLLLDFYWHHKPYLVGVLTMWKSFFKKASFSFPS